MRYLHFMLLCVFSLTLLGQTLSIPAVMDHQATARVKPFAQALASIWRSCMICLDSIWRQVKWLGRHTKFTMKVGEARAQLVPPPMGSDGSLQEWADDWKSLEKNHCHFPRLYGLCPGKALVDQQTPALTSVYKKVLEESGDGASGWSRAWKMSLTALLRDGTRANKIFKGYLKEQSCMQRIALCGSAPQVDGALGLSAAVTEMLTQSHTGTIELLPALPDEWTVGEFRGAVVLFTISNGNPES